jgi:hypothetical protein
MKGTSGYVGVSNPSPIEHLHVSNGNIKSDSNFYAMQRLGIMTSNPAYCLNVGNNSIFRGQMSLHYTSDPLAIGQSAIQVFANQNIAAGMIESTYNNIDRYGMTQLVNGASGLFTSGSFDPSTTKFGITNDLGSNYGFLNYTTMIHDGSWTYNDSNQQNSAKITSNYVAFWSSTVLGVTACNLGVGSFMRAIPYTSTTKSNYTINWSELVGPSSNRGLHLLVFFKNNTINSPSTMTTTVVAKYSVSKGYGGTVVLSQYHINAVGNDTLLSASVVSGNLSFNFTYNGWCAYHFSGFA